MTNKNTGRTKEKLHDDYLCKVDVRMEAGSAEEQPEQCQNHQWTENEKGDMTKSSFYQTTSFLGQKKLRKPIFLTHKMVNVFQDKTRDRFYC